MTSFILIINSSKPFFSVAFSLPAAFDILLKSSWHFLGFYSSTLFNFPSPSPAFSTQSFLQSPLSLNWPSSRLASGFLSSFVIFSLYITFQYYLKANYFPDFVSYWLICTFWVLGIQCLLDIFASCLKTPHTHKLISPPLPPKTKPPRPSSNVSCVSEWYYHSSHCTSEKTESSLTLSHLHPPARASIVSWAVLTFWRSWISQAPTPPWTLWVGGDL